MEAKKQEYTAPSPDPPPDPQTRKYPPQGQSKMTSDPQFLYVQEVYKMTKVLEDGRENG